MDRSVVDPSLDLDAIEAELDEVCSRHATCSQAMLLSRGAMVIGVLTVVGALGFAPAYNTAPVMLGAFTAVIGGLVWFGASRSSRMECEDRRLLLERRRAALFDRVALEHGWSSTLPQTLH